MSKELAIGMLRQWLNEDRITDPRKMVTNEELESFVEQQIIAGKIEVLNGIAFEVDTETASHDWCPLEELEYVSEEINEKIEQLKKQLTQ